MINQLTAIHTKRLWKSAGLIWAFMLTLVGGNFLLPADKRLTSDMVGKDFLAFYSAGTFVREGRAADLHNLEKVRDFQHALAKQEGFEIGTSYGPWWNPPFYAWVFVPLAAMKFSTALAVWELINSLCLLASLCLLVRMYKNDHGSEKPFVQWGLVPAIVLISMPCIQAITHGQNTMVSLLILCAAITCWRSGHLFAAGMVAGLLFYKPQLGMVLALAMILLAGGRAFYGLFMTGTALLLINLITLPGTITDYLAKMGPNLRQFQIVQEYLWDRHVTFRAFFRNLLQGRTPGEATHLTNGLFMGATMVLAAMLIRAGLRMRATLTPENRDLFIAAVIASMPLLMPFYFDYDLLLISVSAVLCARSNPTRLISTLWCVLFVWMYFNSNFARHFRINGSVLILSTLSAAIIHRAGRRAMVGVMETKSGEPVFAVAA